MATSVLRPEVARSPKGIPDRFYAPELNALRLLAFLLAYLRHATAMFGSDKHEEIAAATNTAVGEVGFSPQWELVRDLSGFLDFGVCLFFFLSSFLITRLLLIERSETETIRLSDFYLRRCLRIWPLYFTFLAVLSVLSLTFAVFHSSLPRMLCGFLFCSNIFTALHGWAGTPLDPLWSVSVQEQFYLVCPLCALFGRRGILAMAAGLITLSVLRLASLGDAPGRIVWMDGLVHSLFFAGGALASVHVSRDHRLTRSERWTSLLTGFLCWLFASAGCHIVGQKGTTSSKLVLGYLFVLAGTFLVFRAVLGARFRFPRPVLYLGRITYGLYIFHYLFLELSVMLVRRLPAPLLVRHSISTALAFALTLGCAALSYRYLEGPFLNLKRRFTAVRSQPA